MLEQKLGKHLPAPRPRLRAVGEAGNAAVALSEVERQTHVRMIRALKRHWHPYGMGLIVDQATLGKGTVEDLTDDELVQLHRDMDRARQCIQEDVSFVDAGLLREVG